MNSVTKIDQNPERDEEEEESLKSEGDDGFDSSIASGQGLRSQSSSITSEDDDVESWASLFTVGK